MTNVLLVEDDPTFSSILNGFLKRHEYEVETHYNVQGGLKAINTREFDIVLLDYRLGDGDGLELVDALRSKGLRTPAIIMTSFDDVRTAVKAMRKGVYDYITKPVNPEELLMVLQECLKSDTDRSDSHPEVLPSRKQRTSRAVSPDTDYVQGESRLAKKLQEYIQLVSPTDMSVLIRGESGTGKEYVARAIHNYSKRADKPFVSIDCGTLSKELAASELFGHIKGSFTGAVVDKRGQFEEANGGTLFLDEIGNLSYDVQVKLLRALQERVIQPIGANKTVQVDVRVIAATNEDLVGASSKGNFREDLYHRINEFEILVPPLREREKDLELFINYFMDRANAELGREVSDLGPEVKAVFAAYDWPGNLRELKNVIKRMVLLTQGHTAEISSLPEDMVVSMKTKENKNTDQGTEGDLKSMSEAHERQLIIEVLEKVRYNKSKAAQMLNIDRKTLYNKLEKYNII